MVTATNPLPTQILPSPVEMEHVSTSPDFAKSGTSENGSHLVDTGSQPLKAKVRYLVGDKTTTTTFPPGSLQRMVRRRAHFSLCLTL